MSEQTAEEYEPPRGSVVVVYLGPVAPHWEVRGEFGEQRRRGHSACEDAKADATGAGCSNENGGCYIYLRPPTGVDPNEQVFELSQRKLFFALAGEAILRTETRVVTTDPESRERFRRYWSVFSPGIVLIRYEVLRMVKAEAERGARDGDQRDTAEDTGLRGPHSIRTHD